MHGKFYLLSPDLARFLTSPKCNRTALMFPSECVAISNFVHSHPLAIQRWKLPNHILAHPVKNVTQFRNIYQQHINQQNQFWRSCPNTRRLPSISWVWVQVLSAMTLLPTIWRIDVILIYLWIMWLVRLACTKTYEIWKLWRTRLPPLSGKWMDLLISFWSIRKSRCCKHKRKHSILPLTLQSQPPQYLPWRFVLLSWKDHRIA